MNTTALLEEEKFYYVHNRGNGGANLFYRDEDYPYFLRQYDKHLADYVETYAYCLLPDQFHLLVRIKSRQDFPVRQDFPTQHDLGNLTAGQVVSELFRRFFMGYSKAVNAQQHRTGGLFEKHFRRQEIEDGAHLPLVVYYIHRQPEHEPNLSGADYREYPWSSYGFFVSDKKTRLRRAEVLAWFGGEAGLVRFHDTDQDTGPVAGWMAGQG